MLGAALVLAFASSVSRFAAGTPRPVLLVCFQLRDSKENREVLQERSGPHICRRHVSRAGGAGSEFSGHLRLLGEFLDHPVALQFRQVVDEQLAVQMV